MSRVPGFESKRVQISNLSHCILSSLLPWRSIGRSNFDRGLHNLILFIKQDIENGINYGHSKTAMYIYIHAYIIVCVHMYVLDYAYCAPIN